MVPPTSPVSPNPAAEQSWLRRQARRMLGRNLRSVYDSQDLAQEVQLAALKAAPGKTFANAHAFRSWLLVILRNLTVQKGRGARRRGPSEDVAWSQLPGASSGPGRGAERGDDAENARKRLARLSERDRQIVMLRIGEGLSFREIGERLSMDEAHTRVTFNRNIKKLRSGAGIDPDAE